MSLALNMSVMRAVAFFWTLKQELHFGTEFICYS